MGLTLTLPLSRRRGPSRRVASTATCRPASCCARRTLTLNLALTLTLAITKTCLVLRQAARRQLCALLRPCGRWGRHAAERLLPNPREEEAEAERAQSRVLEEGALERAMERVKEGVITGHLHRVSEVNTQLKAMCFRQDSMALPLREPLQAVLSQLDELRRVNRKLRLHALEFGWE